MKQILIITIILGIGLVSALYGGETKIINFGFETDNCSIIPNQTDGINFTFIDNNVIVQPAINFIGSFNITCYDWLTREEQHYSSGGSSCKYKKDFNWNCSAWSNCENLIQTRTCKKFNNCGNAYGKPNLNQSCTIAGGGSTPYNETEVIEEINPKPQKDKSWFVILIVLVIISFGLLVRWIIQKLKKKEEDGKSNLRKIS